MPARKMKFKFLALIVVLLFSGLAFGEHQVLIDGSVKNFEYRRTITIQSSQVVGGPHSNFPMLFDSTKPTGTGLPDDLRTQGYGGKVRNANGDDIVFATGNGVEILKHEIEDYDEEFGDYVAWVRVESINNGTVIYLYYGSDDSITYPANFATDVWDINYKLVHHLEETDIDGGFEDIKDSTSYGNHGTTEGMSPTAQVGGQIDGSFGFDGSNDEVEFGSDPTYTFDASETFTYEIWFNFDPTQPFTYPNIWSDENDTASTGLDFYLEANSVRLYCNGGSDVVNSGILTGNTWYYAAVTYNNMACELFINESSVDTGSQTFNDSTGTFEIGIYDDESMFLEGKLDEVRISDIVRGDGWIRTSYNNQNLPASFYSISGPTLVELSYFRAKGLNSAVLLEWATETELDNEGFNVWRSEERDKDYARINPYFIPTEGDAGFGAEYSCTDYDVQNGVIYYYKLEDIDIYGKSTFHGPVPAIPNDIIPIWPDEWEILSSGELLFNWSSSDSYSFKVDMSTNPSIPASETLSFPENRWISSHSIWLTPREWAIVLRKAQESGGQLFWRIRAKSEDGRVVCSDWRRFVIEGHRLPEE